MARLIGVYGSLRAGGSNHPRLRPANAPAAEPQAMVRIPGRLYSMGTYCCAVPLAGGESGDIVAEIYEVDEAIYGELEVMEREFGFVGIESTVTDAGGVERTFVAWYRPAAPAGAERIEAGDWVAYCRNRNLPY